MTFHINLAPKFEKFEINSADGQSRLVNGLRSTTHRLLRRRIKAESWICEEWLAAPVVARQEQTYTMLLGANCRRKWRIICPSAAKIMIAT